MKLFNIKKGAQFAVLFIITILSFMRIYSYGSAKLSIASNDTISYIEASQVPLFSSEILTGRRLLSSNLIYKILEPKTGYEILVNGSLETARRIVQPSFTRIVILQLVLSVLGWGLLAYIVSKRLTNASLKALSAGFILMFAFTPQIADWDSILMSESLTFSLFAIQLALLIEFVFLSYANEYSKAKTYLTFWALVFFLWTFLKDANLFVSLVTMGMILLALYINKSHRNKVFISALIFLSFVLVLGFTTASQSTRSQVQMINIYQDDLLVSESRINALKSLGMPDPQSQEYPEWFRQNSSKALIKFMLIHPGYPILKIVKDFPSAFTEIKQTYFDVSRSNLVRHYLMLVGEALHPENTTPFLLSGLLLFGITLLALKTREEASVAWAWVGYWMFLTAGFTLIPVILGDTWALNRHALFSTTVYRLFMWMFSIVIIDIAIAQSRVKINSK